LDIDLILNLLVRFRLCAFKRSGKKASWGAYKKETLEYKKFKNIVEEIIELSIQLSKEKIELAKKSLDSTA